MIRIFGIPALAMLLGALLVSVPGVQAGHSGAKPDIKVVTAGTGAEAVRHSKVSVHYTGWLMDGTKFDSSLDRGKPFEFTLGAGQVIPGWDMGVAGMKVGGTRVLTIPPGIAYGKKGAGGVIPPNATLKFEIRLLAVTPPGYSNIDNGALKALLAEGVKIVDLRRPDEWDKTGVIENSKLLTAFDGTGGFRRGFPRAIQEFAASDEKVILICQHGNRSAAVANLMVERAGYKKVYNVTHGIEKWIKDGKPVVRRK